jgi:carboxymethylenebutenolidase
VILSSGYGYGAASINYGGLPKDIDEIMKNACPIVASYGALDRTLKGSADRLELLLEKHQIDHDVMEYPDTDHAFINDHDPKEVPLFIEVISFVFGGGAHHPESAKHARQRIVAFFNKHLKEK